MDSLENLLTVSGTERSVRDTGTATSANAETAVPAQVTFDTLSVAIQELVSRVQSIALNCERMGFPSEKQAEIINLGLRIASADLVKCGASIVQLLQHASIMADVSLGASGGRLVAAVDRLQANDPAGAIAILNEELDAPDRRAEIYKLIGDAELSRGNGDASLLAYQRALELGFPREMLQQNLALACISQFLYGAAEEELQQLLFRDHGLLPIQRQFPSADSPYPIPDRISVTAFKLEDRAEQIEYLVETGKLDHSFVELVSAYRLGAKCCSPTGVTDLDIASDERLRLIGPYHDRILHYRPTPRIEGPAVNPDLDFERLAAEYARTECIWFDDLLTPKALVELRSFLQESTIFFRQSPAGFVGTYVTDGLSCGLMFQIAEELRNGLPQLLANRPINNMWCYRYGAEGPGVRTHNGDGSVTINFYLTQDDAHLGTPNEGGMVMYDKSHPDEWDWLTLNRDKDQPEVQAKIAQYLTNSSETRVGYACNRAVLFQSTLFHKTDPFKFKNGFSNRRMNITILFGRRGQESAPLADAFAQGAAMTPSRMRPQG